jgi:nitrous oxidase accessory protein NosD
MDLEGKDQLYEDNEPCGIDPPIDFTPIVIDGNEDLINQSTSNGWQGNGTISNPYIIENIDFPSYSGFGMEIKNVDLHIIIRNCTSKTEFMETAIHLDNSRNLTLRNISIDGRGQLIYLSSSSLIEMIDIRTGGRCIDYWGNFRSCNNISISESNLGDRSSFFQCDGVKLNENNHERSSINLQETRNIILMNSTVSGTIQFRECSGFVIKNCVHGDSTSYGFSIVKCFNGIMRGNNLSGARGQVELIDSRDIKMYNNSLGLEGLKITGEVSDLHSLEIPVNNTIDGEPIVMIKDNNLTSLEENPNPSQIIMINITTLQISGNDFDSDLKSIQIIQSDNVIFDNLTISNSSFGISMLRSKKIHIEDCSMENLYFGAINIENSEKISVENCVFSDIMDEYFKITGSRDFSFKSLIITEDNYGDIFEVGSSLNGTFRDIRINSGFAPFNIDHCKSLRIEGCNISSNYGIQIEESEDIILKNNRIETEYNGIRFEDDENVIIVDNIIISESRSGVYQEYCQNIVYYSNKLDKCSFIFKCRPDDQLGILLPSNNTVDGKPVLHMNAANSRSINNDDIWGQIVIDEVSGYKVEDLTIVNKNYPFQVFSSFGFKIHNCSFIDTYSGIKTQNSESMRITSTLFDNTTLCINAESAGNLFIEKCSFNNTNGGISIWSRWSDDIKNTKILDCSFNDSKNCIDVEDIQTVDVDRCSFKEGTRAISFRYGMKGYIRNCELSNISGYGFSLYRFSESIIDSNILINVSTGLITDRSNTQKVHDNLFAECSDQAIKSEYGYNEPNWFYNNIFINNNGAGELFNSSHIQAISENEKDYWNNSLGRGNYWSDWTGPDKNNDGIVDKPYNLSGGSNHDNYPLLRCC